MQYFRRRPVYVDYILLIIGTGLLALAVNAIYEPMNLVTGGVTGLAIVVKAWTGALRPGGIPIWFTNLVLNVPIFLVAIKVKGMGFAGRSLFATAFLSMWLYLLPSDALIAGDLILVAIFGGVMAGAGIGLVLIAKGTTGGSDMLAAIVQKYLRHYSIAEIMQVIDAVIVLLGAFVFGITYALYAIIAIVVATRVSDGMIEGLKLSRAAYIITNRHAEVAEVIFRDLERGVTGINATGMYSGEHRSLLFCVVSKKEVVQLKELVYRLDPDAFVIVCDAREVLGEGFGEYSSD